MPVKPPIDPKDAIAAGAKAKSQMQELRSEIVTPEQEMEVEALVKDQNRKVKWWNKVRENVKNDQGYSGYQDFLAVMIAMIKNLEDLSRAINASMRTTPFLGKLYPASMTSLFTDTIPALIALPFKLTGAILGGFAKLPGVSNFLALVADKFPNDLPIIKELQSFDKKFESPLFGEMKLKIDEKGALKADFAIQGQDVKDETFLEKFRTISFAYLQSKGYDLADGNGDDPVVVYAANHKGVGGPNQPQVGDVILAKDFEADVTKDNYAEMRGYMSELANKETLVDSAKRRFGF
ncbi:MAG: hypothetical protein NTW08_08270 [Gammaproteobacteria bacterium]|nr:hypothetical protein [Gammaproteobacteria bacterium]